MINTDTKNLSMKGNTAGRSGSLNGNSNTSGGLKEGVARALSQACVYPIETRKTLLQIHGSIPKFTKQLVLRNLCTGLSTSCITAGFIFSVYFSIYNRLIPSPFAGSIAAFTTSFIKLPIGNSMRVMQSGSSRNIIQAGRQLCKNEGILGLYKGYGLCVIEDAIDMDLRMRLYNGLRTLSNNKVTLGNDHLLSIGFGAISGAVACGITTPFDTVRAKMCFETAAHVEKSNALHITKSILKKNGIRGFYKGGPLRILSNTVKSSLFFWFFHIIENSTNKSTQK